MSDHVWHVYLWECLECDVRYAKRLMGEAHEDYDTAVAFVTFCEETVSELRAEYGLAE